MTKATGPFWVNETTEGEHQVCGARGKVLFRYSGDHASAMAADHVRRLMKVDKAANARLIGAAPEMLASLRELLKLRAPDLLTNQERGDIINRAVDLLARIEGEA